MADYPGAIKSFPTLVDNVDSVLALHPNQRGDEITAIETELGTLPKGSDASVKARLDRIDNVTGKALEIIQGGMVNGKIVVSVASNNLTVAINTLAGADPSMGDPVYVRIGNTVRSITTALSVTKNAGTNWCNAGSSEMATLEVDYFVYLGYNATDGVVIGFSRIPFGRVYGDFNTTSSHERYCAISTITNAASTDEYEVIGRFNAKLSAGAGYTWSIPATSIVVSRPIHETRWLTWNPAYSGGGSMTYSTVTTSYARYKIVLDRCQVLLYATGTTGGTASISLRATIPINAVDNLSYYLVANVRDAASGAAPVGGGVFDASVPALIAQKADVTNFGLGTGRIMILNGSYPIN